MNKKKHHTIIYYFIVWTLAVLFTISSISLITMQTFWGREKIRSGFIYFASKHNINLKIESLEGLIPFEYKLKKVNIILDDLEINIEKLDCRLKILPLLRNRLTFKSFNAEDISIKEIKSSSAASKDDNWLSLPITVKFDNLNLNNLYVKTKNTLINLKISGKAFLEKNGILITTDVLIKRKNFENSYLNLSLKGTKENRSIDLKAYLNVDSLKVFDFLIKKESLDLSFDMHFATKGSLNSYLGYLQKNDKKYAKIEGNAFGNIFDLQLKNKDFSFLLDKETKFSFNFSTLENLKINISKGLLKNDLLDISSDALLTKNFIIDKTNLTFKIEDLSKIKTFPYPIFGSFLMKSAYEKANLVSTYSFEKLKFNDFAFEDFKGSIKGALEKNRFNGNISSSFYVLDQVFDVSSDYKFEASFLTFSNLKINSPSSTLNANLTLTPALALIGKGKIHLEDFKQIQILYPKLIFYGLTDVNFEFKQKIENEKALQNLLIKIAINDFHLKTFVGKTLNISMNIDNPFSNPSMDLDVKFDDLRFRELLFNTLYFTTSTKEENWPYKINTVGNLKQPFNIDSHGFWKMKKHDFLINIQDISGYLFSHNFITPKPIKFEISEDIFLLTELSLELAESSLFADIDFTKKNSIAKINLKHFPLDFLSINPLDLDITGFATLNLNLNGSFENIESTLDLDLEGLNILSIGDIAPLQANGKLKSELKNKYLNMDGLLNVKETQLLSFIGKIPVDIDLVKLSLKLNENKNIFLGLKYNGKIEEIFDFINIGPQRIEGNINSQIELSNKISNLDINGFCLIKNGYYENYYTGTIIKDIEVNFKASKEKIILEYLKGKDTEKGTITADGLFSFSRSKNFPFFFKTEIKDLQCVDSDIFQAVATANIEIAGDRFSSVAKGNVFINKLDMTIPDKLPIVIPDLNPIFIYHPYHKIKKEEDKPAIYPLHLNFDIDASKTPISINGSGLTSTWSGLFKIGGTYMNVETRGGLELIKGKYIFSSRQFDLTKGNVIFNGKPNEMPSLDIQAKITHQGVDIFANMKGPLDRPKIVFTSSPALPASSIMSLLIFGQQLSELSASQTVELSSLMGTQIDQSTLPKTDTVSSLGIDRFNVVKPSPTDPFATDQMAVQIGKYISKGTVISFSQGEEQGSTNVIVEVDLRKGFIFQAESQQEQEQGKFTLKYRYNY
jgi:hypothetical protein